MAQSEIQALAQLLDRHRREADRFDEAGIVDGAPQRAANTRAIYGLEAAIEALPISDDVDALLTVGLLTRIVLGELKDCEFESRSERRLLCRLVDYLQSKTGRDLLTLCHDLADDRIAPYLACAPAKGVTSCH